MSDRPRTICEACREPIEPDENDVLEAVEIQPMRGFGAPNDTAEGMTAVFHSACFPHGNPRYRLR